MDEHWKRSGQIPAFGNWDIANELPITQYFECARQAGLRVRYSSSSAETDRDLHSDHLHINKPLRNRNRNRNLPPSALKQGATRNGERAWPHQLGKVMMVKEKENSNVMRKQGKVCDVTEPPSKKQPIGNSKKKQQQLHLHDAVLLSPPPPRPPKPVDEDLYKIPPELLHTTKRKKMLGYISKCLVPTACVS